MKILTRLSQLFRSNINAAIEKMRDPAKEVEQLIDEMEDELRKSKIELRDQLAQAKQLEKRIEEQNRNIYRFQEHAKRAVQVGDDGLAKEALRHLQAAEQQLLETQKLFNEQSTITSESIARIKKNEQKLQQIKLRKETLKSQARLQQERLSSEGSAFDRFEQLVSDIELSEHQAEAMIEIAQLDTSKTTASKEERFDRLLGESGQKATQQDELEHRLQALKASMGKS